MGLQLETFVVLEAVYLLGCTLFNIPMNTKGFYEVVTFDSLYIHTLGDASHPNYIVPIVKQSAN